GGAAPVSLGRMAISRRRAKRTGRGQLTQLGHTVPVPQAPLQARLPGGAKPHPRRRYVVRFVAPEFTSLCPITGQPDFAHLVIDYVPARWLVESKCLQLDMQ